MSNKNFRFISSSRPPVENKRFVAGRGNFVADIERPNMAHVAPLSSPHPAALINHIDSSEALSLDGVIDVTLPKRAFECY